MTIDRRAALALLASLVAGCGKPKAAPCRASGIVRVNGAAAKGACVRLHLVGSDALPQAARCESDGSFSLAVPRPGEYALTLFWTPVTVVQGEEVEGDDRFKGRHAQPGNPVLKATIKEGANPFPPIDLKHP